MSDFLLIAPGGFTKVPDVGVFPYSAEYFRAFEGVQVPEDVSQLFRDAGLITVEQSIGQVKFISETGDVWYSVQE